MPDLATSTVSTSKTSWEVLGLAALFVASAWGVTFSLVGELSETVDPEYADYLWRPWPFLDEHANAVGVVSGIVLVMSAVALALARRSGRMPAPLLAQVLVVTLFAAWLGLGYRVLTAGVTGANIGGGWVALLTPVFAVVTIARVKRLGAELRP